jgi:methionyl-tRNA formyltransferase
MMRALVLTSTKESIPALSELGSRNLLSGLIVPARDDEEVHMIKAWSSAQRVQVSFCTRENLLSVLSHAISSTACDIVIVFGFSWKIPHSLLSVPPHGFFNVHFSLLPAYRGPMPVFWQMRNGVLQTGVTIHRMDKDFDTGDIACSVALPVLPGETNGLCSARLGQASVKLVMDLITMIGSGTLQLIPQQEEKASYHARPGDEMLMIDWTEHGSLEIQNVVNACNPKYHGALTWVNGMPLRVLEVTPADAPDYPGAVAGTVVHADINHGLFVICKDRKTLRLSIVQLPEGIISGGKLAALGIVAGMRFAIPFR